MYKDGENHFLLHHGDERAVRDAADAGGVREGILKGMYRFRESQNKKSKLRAQLFGSGAILHEVLRAQEILGDKIRRRRGCLERDELQGTLHRRN